ncbi:response regulator receiver modulated diguanylate cyclase [Tistlia consotensis]|uniref:diguanylate cyclase n=1 Tax=Tistlia consotensis USBA 355 TaxID=560819 RepID=A0A1Y6BVN7_9PROT|nr:PleD family two-component system response regulator [Tistlia consotensis]SMF20785.1 response regulator receiver modulated diguanylate cyclase [Tistlia consotensis USBA 355]SNR47540.1 response regulator receiver modulated diguanylate cyclase [Tistlia consotensis]
MSARILVVDDILPNVKVLEAKLTAEYFDVITAFDGAGALERAVADSPDVILLDVMMPGMDGFEVCRRLRQDPQTRHIPVVMVTALTDVSDRVRGLEAGADDFLSKPINDHALFARVRSLVRLKTLTDELRARQATAGSSELEDLGAEEALAGAHVLIVDAQQHRSQRIADQLRQAGHEVEIVGDAAEAMQRSQAEPALDLAIVHIDLSGQDGMRLCGQLRSQETTRQLPLLLVLDESDLPRLAKGLELGVSDYLIEPVDRNELRARVRTQLRRRRYYHRLRSLLDRTVSMAYTDPLTGAYNRRYLKAHLERKLMEMADSSKPVSIMLFDLDRFKLVNDELGHDAGDAVLKEVSQRVGNNVRSFDMLARYGGEEFVVIMPDTDAEHALAVADRLRRLIGEKRFGVPGRDEGLTVTFSAGVATATDPMETGDQLLKRADAALYEAKGGGRDRVVAARPADLSESDPQYAYGRP